jgi:predicted secreted hydrolase
MAPRSFVFPDDHGPHPEYRVEWWYVTGNLSAADGRAFGYQLTFFRSAQSPQARARTSAWATNQIFMAHLALSDVRDRRFLAFERFSRAAAGLAGARAAPFRVWLEDWSVASTDSAPPTSSADAIFPLRVQAAQGDVAINLTLERGRPMVLQGDKGFSRKGSESGNASHYYSFTRMTTRGTIAVGKQSFQVSGESWLDREWGTSGLAPQLAGWDWFALRLSNGVDLMLYRLRTTSGGTDPFSGGTVMNADETTRALAAADFSIDVLSHWQSPLDGTRYPSRWRVAIPSEQLELEVLPLLPDQELNLSVRYWEGAVQINGRAGGQRVNGRGYAELTGYAGQVPRSFP